MYHSKQINMNIMTIKKIFVTVVAVTVLAGASWMAFWNTNWEAQYERRNTRDFMVPPKGAKNAIEFLSSLHGERLSRHIDHRDVVNARHQLKRNMANPKGVNLQWDEVGPDNVAGRVRGFCLDPADPKIMYTGGVSGGLWKTTTGGTSWIQIMDVSENLAISSVEMGPNGEVYAGTGESFANVLGNNYSTPGVIGTGIYKSYDGDNFSLLSSTVPAAGNNPNVDWALVNRIAVDPHSGDVYAATNRGLKYSSDGGYNWDHYPLLPNGQPQMANIPDVKISPGGVIVAVVGHHVHVSKTGKVDDFVNVSTTSSLPNAGILRTEVAISPNNQTIYAVIASDGAGPRERGELLNIYMSDDTGDTWSIIGPGGSSNFDVFGPNNQGGYDNVVGVSPTNPYHVFVGGIHMWEGEQIIPGQTYAWQQITQGSLDQIGTPFFENYVHVDHHVYKFHPNNPNTMYAGTDGGIFRTQNKGKTFSALNRNLNITQFYAVAIGPHGGVMGGTQDNSTPYVSGKGNTPMNADVLFMGDGGHAAFSVIDQDVLFVTSQFGVLGRTNDKGTSYQRGIERDASGNPTPGFYDQRMLDYGIEASFVTPIQFWESVNVDNSRDSVWFQDTTQSYAAGDTLLIRSNTNRYPFHHILTQNLDAGDELQVADPVQSRFFLGTDDGVWMTRQALDFSNTPEWYKIADIDGMVQSMVISQDGDMMYVGTRGGFGNSGKVYRISNIMSAWDSTTADVTGTQQVIETELIREFATGRWVTSIALDPADKDHIIVTLGNYGETTYIYRSTDATSANPSFQSRQGDLPAMPVYAALIPMNHSNTVLIGTEYGVYATSDITAPSPVWAEENEGMDKVPVHMFAQQTRNLPYITVREEIDGEVFTDVYPGISNYGEIAIGTHGRGLFSTKKYVGMEEPPVSYASGEKKPQIKIYPNPVFSDNANVEVKLKKQTRAVFRIFDMTGRLHSEKTITLDPGEQNVSFNLGQLKRGTYIIQMVTDDNVASTTRFIKL